jgi:5-hydroxyisourate hydrolase
MITISSHVLDTSRGQPASDLAVRLDVLDGAGGWRTVAEGLTNDDGRVTDLAPGVLLGPGTYRVAFETAAYHLRCGQPVFYPRIEIVFRIESLAEHFHIPLLLSPFGYSTYRGS